MPFNTFVTCFYLHPYVHLWYQDLYKYLNLLFITTFIKTLSQLQFLSSFVPNFNLLLRATKLHKTESCVIFD